MITTLIILGLFGVYVLNNKVAEPKNTKESLLKLAVSPSPSPVQASITQSDASASASSEKESVTATIKTSKGNIELTLYPQKAPNTVANFVKKSQESYYKNLIFHRVEDWVVQGGDPDGNGTGGGNMSTELNSQPFVIGSLGVARGGDIRISNDSQFFITKTDASWLNGQYTNFGKVIDGMDVVNQLEIGDRILDINIR